MASKTVLRKRLEYWTGLYGKLQEAYEALVVGGVKSYTLRDRQLTRLDLPDLMKQMELIEEKIDELESVLNGGGRRGAFGVVPRDW